MVYRFSRPVAPKKWKKGWKDGLIGQPIRLIECFLGIFLKKKPVWRTEKLYNVSVQRSHPITFLFSSQKNTSPFGVENPKQKSKQRER